MHRRVANAQLLWAGPLAGLVAAVLNGIVYSGASSLGVLSQDVVVEGRGPITLGAVLFMSFLPALLAAGLVALLRSLTRRPVRNFVVVAAAVFALSLFLPFTLSEAPVDMILVLLLMHAVAAVVITGILVVITTRGTASDPHAFAEHR